MNGTCHFTRDEYFYFIEFCTSYLLRLIKSYVNYMSRPKYGRDETFLPPRQVNLNPTKIK